MTDSLCFLYHFIVHGRPINMAKFSDNFQLTRIGFPSSSKRPVSFNMMLKKDGAYAIDKNDPENSNTSILSQLVFACFTFCYK